MSSRYKGRSSKGSGSGGGEFPTRWSEWEWNAEHQRNVRYRLKSPGNYEYEYGTAVQPADVPRTPTTNFGPIPEQYSSLSHYTATSSIETVTRDLGQTSLDPVTPQQTPIAHPLPAPTFPGGGFRGGGYITTRDHTTKEESFDPNYKVHFASEFQWGKVFKILWAEPKGNAGSESTGESEYSVRKGRHGEKFYEKVRRFVVVDARDGHCICLPIMTYSDQGVNKKGVHARDHTIIYTDKPICFPGEQEKGLLKNPIKVKPTSPRHKLSGASRLNYAKLYTVEYNVKVWFIGKIHHDSENVLIADYNALHPLMQPRGVASASADTYAYVGGATDTYRAPYSTYTAPVSYSTSTPGNAATSSASSYLGNTTLAPYSSDRYSVSPATYSGAQTVPSYQTTSLGDSRDPPYQTEDQPPNPYDNEPYYDD